MQGSGGLHRDLTNSVALTENREAIIGDGVPP